MGAARTAFGYDSNGNRTEKVGPSLSTYYAWDEDNRLIVAEPASGAVTLAYDVVGRRIRKERYLYDFEKAIRELIAQANSHRAFSTSLAHDDASNKSGRVSGMVSQRSEEGEIGRKSWRR